MLTPPIGPAPAPPLAAAGHVFAFIGAKGGVGTTTLAVNTATALGLRRRALLIDLHQGDGDAALFMNVAPVRSLADACSNVHRLDDRYLRRVVTPLASHLDLLAAPGSRVSTAVDAARVNAVIQQAAASYQYVVLDVSRAYVPILESLDMLAALLVVVEQDFIALRCGRRLADGLKSCIRHDRVSAVVNRFDPHSEAGERHMARVLGVNVTGTVPDDYPSVLASIGLGTPVVLREPNPLRDALTALAARLAGDARVDDLSLRATSLLHHPFASLS